MVFPSLQVALALSCVMGLVMFARYCGEDQFHKIGNLSKNEVSRSVCYYFGLSECIIRVL